MTLTSARWWRQRRRASGRRACRRCSPRGSRPSWSRDAGGRRCDGWCGRRPRSCAISRSRSVSAPTPASGRRRRAPWRATRRPRRRSSRAAWSSKRRAPASVKISRAAVSAAVASRWWPPAASAWPASSCARAASSRLPTRVRLARGDPRGAGGAGAVARRQQDGGAGAPRLARARGQAEAGRGHLGVGGVAVGLGEAAGGQLGARQDLVPARLERALDELQLGLQQLDGRVVVAGLEVRLGQIAGGERAPVAAGQLCRVRFRAGAQREVEIAGQRRDPAARRQRPAHRLGVAGQACGLDRLVGQLGRRRELALPQVRDRAPDRHRDQQVALAGGAGDARARARSGGGRRPSGPGTARPSRRTGRRPAGRRAGRRSARRAGRRPRRAAAGRR